MNPYADTDFFTRVYLQLPDSAEADRLLLAASRSAAASLPLTWLHRVEIVNAFQLHVIQSRDAGQPFISTRQVAAAQTNAAATHEERIFSVRQRSRWRNLKGSSRRFP